MYGQACAHHPRIELSLPVPDEELEKWIQNIFDNSTDAGLHIPSVRAYADKYLDALNKGYGDISNIDYSSPDGIMVSHLKSSIYTFSMAKNKAELKALTENILDGKGKVRSWPAFKKAASDITDTFRGPWLEAEYELAVAGSQMASKWVEFERTGDNTLLKYSTVHDARVSDICRPLDGIIKPMNDKFWDINYPPNHFRCRCDVDRLVTGTATPDSKISQPVIPKMLRVNLAKEKLLFPKDHPYYKAATNVTTSRSKLLDKVAAYEDTVGISVDKSIFEYVKPNVEFTNIKYEKRGAFYTEPPPRVNIPFDARRFDSKWYAEAVVYHEFGHAAAYEHSFHTNKLVGKLMTKYRKAFSANESDLYKNINTQLWDLRKRASKLINKDFLEKVGAAQDTLMALNPKYGAGHKPGYFSRKYSKEHEFIAHMFENRFAGNEVFKNAMPELYEEMRALADELKNEIIK